jgi:hypothetical protein
MISSLTRGSLRILVLGYAALAGGNCRDERGLEDYQDTVARARVPRETAVYSPGDRNDLQPGVKIFIAAATKQADGTLLTLRVTYGKDGITPPM